VHGRDGIASAVDLGLQGTAAIVGGASAGMGLAIARVLAEEGCAVTMCARDGGRLAEAAAGVAGDPLAIAGDVRDHDLLRRLVDDTVAARGRLDIVVNNAGGPPAGVFEGMADEAWADAFELSLRPVLRLSQLALPHLRRSGRGRIVNITSWSVREPIANLVLSNAIRPGVVGWAKTLSHEVGAHGITVNTIAPGKIATGRMHELWESRPDPAAAEAQEIATIPAGRMGTPEEVAAAVAFLCSTAAGYISGVVLPVDGGSLHGVW
jgi:3-oxoacyl-[acyl-carrier protein] reductase